MTERAAGLVDSLFDRLDWVDATEVEPLAPLPSALRDKVGQYVTVTGEPAVLVSGGGFAVSRTEYLPVHPTLVVEVQAEASVWSFTNRLRPTIQRVRPDMTLDDLA